MPAIFTLTDLHRADRFSTFGFGQAQNVKNSGSQCVFFSSYRKTSEVQVVPLVILLLKTFKSNFI